MEGPTITGQVCEPCRTAITEAYKLAAAAEPGYGPRVVLSPSFAALEASAARGGCDACRIARRRIIGTVFRLADLVEDAPVLVWWCLEPPPLAGYDTSVSASNLHLRVPLVDAGFKEVRFLFTDLELGNTTAPEREAGGQIIKGFDDDAEFDQLIATIKGWLEVCDNTHQLCRRPSQAGLPTHVIDVRPKDDPESLRLVEGSSCDPQTPYITLSYCWGQSGRNFKTTRSSLAAMARAIPWPRLPQTVKDAVAVTRRLGLRYLWVDALCIVQEAHRGDAGSDWAIEAPRMGAYYAGAAVTLAASSAEDCADGFLRDRPAGRLAPAAPLSIGFGELFLDGRPRARLRSGPPPAPDPRAAMEDSALLRRGWCVQERALSARLLYFARDAVFWECAELRAAEDRPARHLVYAPETANHSYPLAQYWRQRVGPWDLLGSGLSGLARELEDTSQRKDLVDVALGPSWMNMVERYSASQFSFPSDKLVALSSIASKLQGLTGGTYIAGHWLETLGQSLAWSVVEAASPTGPSTKAQGRDIPSWSWVSVDLAVGFDGLDDGAWAPAATVEYLPPSSASTSKPPTRPPAIRVAGLFCEQTLQQWNLRPTGTKLKYGAGSRARYVVWDAEPAPFDARARLACIFLGVLGASEYAEDTFAIVLQRTGNAEGDVEEFVRAGLLRFENFNLTNMPGVRKRTVDIV